MRIFRWILFPFAGVFEIGLAILAGATATMHYVSSICLYIAYMLPSMDWYRGGDYKRKPWPHGVYNPGKV